MGPAACRRTTLGWAALMAPWLCCPGEQVEEKLLAELREVLGEGWRALHRALSMLRMGMADSLKH